MEDRREEYVGARGVLSRAVKGWEARTDVGVELGLVELVDELGEGLEGAVHCESVRTGEGSESEVGSGRDGTVGSDWGVPMSRLEGWMGFPHS